MPQNDRHFSIGEVSQLSGAGIETIRYYEKIGLMPVSARNAGGHRVFDEKSMRRLFFIRKGRKIGFSQKEVRGLLNLVDDHNYSCGEVHDITLEHLKSVQTKIQDLQRLESALAEMLGQCKGGNIPECPIIDILFSDSVL